MDGKARQQEFVSVAEFVPTECPRLTHLHTVTGMTVPYTQTSSSPSRKWTVEVLLGQ